MLQGSKQHAAQAELTDHPGRHGSNATIASALRFMDAESRQKFHELHRSGVGLELVVTGPVRPASIALHTG